jgi:hypothetical protein
MTIQEFSTEFDVLYNNVTSNQAPGLNEYEKSVFLTKAQSQLVNEYFNSRTDGFGGGFDGSQKRQYDFSGLVRVEKLFDINTFKERIDDTEKLDRRSKVFLFPQDYFLAVNEILSDEKGQYSVIPLSYVEYQRLMLKPYNFPVKRAAWRILTDKKNCNYAHEDASGNNVGDLPTAGDYKIFSTWADQKRGLKVTIKVETTTFTGHIPSPTVADHFIKYNSTLMGIPIQINAGCEWDSSKMNYEVSVVVTFSASDVDNVSDVDDETAIEILKEGFALAKTILGDNWDVYDYDVIKAANHTDGFLNCSAPSKFTTFQDDVNGRTFECSVIQVPMAEIIGKFKGDIQYQLRYIRNLNPIILDDLSNYGTGLTIGGVTSETPCTLPEETHQEILERAVTLAKIAWQGGTATQAAQQRNDN